MHGEQRTANITPMSVTREVSQLRGWLKAYAFCRGSQAGHTVRGGLRAGITGDNQDDMKRDYGRTHTVNLGENSRTRARGAPIADCTRPLGLRILR